MEIITSLTRAELISLILEALNASKITNHPIEVKPKIPLDSEYFTLEEITKKLKVSRSTIYNFLRQGLIKSKRMGRRRLFTEEDIKVALEKGSHE